MAGLISLHQGPFGVAASARRPDPRSGKPGVTRALAGARAGLDPALRQPHPALPTANADIADIEENQEPAGTVGSATLFETSRLAALLLPADAQKSAPPPTRGEPWTPPRSSLSLHDSVA